MIKIKWFLLLFLFPILIFSQDKIIKGKVVDKAGLGIPGVTVVLKDSNTATTTNFDGDYSIATGKIKNGILVFSYIGYTSKNMIFNNQTNTINVALSESQQQLDEVVVTALGIKREKKSLAYATQTIDTQDMTEARSTNFLNALSGKAAGVQIVKSGTPTGSTRVVIRGLTSVTGDNQPLYVIDGIALDSGQGDGSVSVWNDGGKNTAVSDIDYGSPLSHINPDDIDSIDILKGPNAAALYGSRASNGVVLITTKKGKTNSSLGVTINSNSSYITNREYPYYQYVYGSGSGGRLVSSAAGIDPVTGLPSVAGINSYRAYGALMLGQDIMGFTGMPSKYLPKPNNIKELYQMGVVTTNSVAIDKGGDLGSFRLSFANTSGDHVMENLEVQKKNNLTFRGSQKISKSLTTDISVLYTNNKVKNRTYQNGSERNPANNYMYMLPDMGKDNLLPYKTDDNVAFAAPGNGPFKNPYWNLYENSNQDEANNLIGNVTLNWEILKGLSLKSKVNGSVNLVQGEEFNNMGAAYDPDGFYRTFNNQTQNWNYEAILNYNKKFEDFSIVALVGANRFDLTSSQRQTRINSLLVRDVRSLSNSNGIPEVIEIDARKRINSGFSSLSLGYKNTYFMDVTARNDWSSTLPSNNNSYFYPSIGGSFIFSELIPKNDILTYGKIRASYAQVGNDTKPYNTITNYQYGGLYNGSAWLASQTTRNNSDLKPELTSSNEFGIETRLFKNRVSLSATYYESSTINQIIAAQTSSTSGFSSQFFNAGEIRSKGMEVVFSGKIIDNSFKWAVDLNWSKNESLVVSLIDGVDRLSLRTWFNVNVFAEVGKPLGELRGNVQARDPETGIPLVLENGRVAWKQNQVLGNAQPDWIGGLKNAFSYNGFSLNVLLDAKIGGEMYSGTMLKTVNQGAHADTYAGRDEFLFSSVIMGETNEERFGRGLYGNTYADIDRVKGRQYAGSAISTTDANGNLVAKRDANGNIVYSNAFISPETYGFDGLNDQLRFTYDASYVKLREITFGYTFPNKFLKGSPFKRAKFSLVGRDLWTIYRNTPQGIDPEAGTTSGNGQGIEYGSFLPTRTLGININLGF
ncbi:SusC/RagA family TonB-linked outer membrane protein [Flavobacterium sp.]|uniref:SusC/RagA family TonB-linked outer membrane protein n=1 Tax=Flavobacterium sp. TaxID=239 RepID=UPI0038FC9F6E